MTTLAAAPPSARPLGLRLEFDPTRLALAISKRDGSAGYEVLLEPQTCFALALDMANAAIRVEHQAAAVTAEVNAIVEDRRSDG